MTPNQLIEYVRSRAELKAKIEAGVLFHSHGLMTGYKILVGVFSQKDIPWVRDLLINWGWEVEPQVNESRSYGDVVNVWVCMPKEIRDTLPEVVVS